MLGFAAGWILRGDGGEATVLPAAGATERPDAPKSAAGATTPEVARDARPAAAPARPRSETTVAVLNGAGVTGLAGSTATVLDGSGYAVGVVADGPVRDGPTIVYYAAGFAAEARRLRADLGASPPPAPLPDGPARDAAGDAGLVVLLGAG